MTHIKVKVSICFLLAVGSYLAIKYFKDANKNIVYDMEENDGKPLIVLGILTTDTKADLRNMQRQTWLSLMTSLRKQLPFRIVYKFWFDEPTEVSIRENELYGDIQYLNVTSHGYVVDYGEKLYVFYKYIHINYPNAMMGIRIDDDVFLCVPQVFKTLDMIKSDKLYYGIAWGKGDTVNRHRHVDEMFVVVGGELIHRIAQRQYCKPSKQACNGTHLTEEGIPNKTKVGYGSVALAHWLSIYNDVDFRPDNVHIVHRGKLSRGEKSAIITPDFCQKYIVYHRSNTEVMKTLHKFNHI